MLTGGSGLSLTRQHSMTLPRGTPPWFSHAPILPKHVASARVVHGFPGLTCSTISFGREGRRSLGATFDSSLYP